MPIYEYFCEKCETEFEVTQGITEDALTRHNGGCGGKVKKLMSSNAFHLKGTGWYKTDYADKKTSGGKGSKGDEKGEKLSSKFPDDKKSSDKSGESPTVSKEVVESKVKETVSTKAAD